MILLGVKEGNGVGKKGDSSRAKGKSHGDVPDKKAAWVEEKIYTNLNCGATATRTEEKEIERGGHFSRQAAHAEIRSWRKRTEK